MQEFQLLPQILVTISTIGLEYGTGKSIVNELVADKIALNAGLLNDMTEEWIPHILDALEDTEKCINHLGALARDLQKASGADDQSKSVGAGSSRARETAYSLLDSPFRNWLANINPLSDDCDEVCLRWKEGVRRIILTIGKELVGQREVQVFVGRSSTLNASSAFLKFKNSLYKTVPIREKGGE